ncbi:MAG: hypothetical protein HOO86_13880 [Bacteroidales bacterium]|nr:hypothetical protein [Bacteroidales bacterium]
MRTLVVSTILILFIGIQLYRGSGAKSIIDGDGAGYYAYLPSVFHHKTTDFTAVFEFEKLHKSLSYDGHYYHRHDSVLINKYFLGTALAISPFYLVATFYSAIFRLPTDGYNILYQLAVAMAAAFYLAIGLLATLKLIRLFGFEKHIALLVIIVLFFGTNLFYYALLHPSHSHVYSFAAISVFLLYSRRFFLYLKIQDLFFAAVSLGFVCLIRPTNVLIVGVLPFIAGSSERFKEGFYLLKEKWWYWLLAIMMVMSVLCIQFIFNLVQTGSLFVWSYKNEGFDFLHSHFFGFLFGFKKGFFIYTPVMLAIVPALILMYRKLRFSFYAILLFLILSVFILSSWWNWFYGDSFGMRAMIDLYPLLAVLLAFTVDRFLKWKPGFLLFILTSLTFICFNLFQTYQYNKGILHRDSMNFAKYSYVFLKSSADYEDVLGSDIEPLFIDPVPVGGFSFFCDMEKPIPDFTENGIIESNNALSGKKVALLNEKFEYSPTLVLGPDRLIETMSPVYVKVKLHYNLQEPILDNRALLVYAATNKKNNVCFYKAFRLLDMPTKTTNTWLESDFGFKVSAWDNDLSQVKVYVWNPSKNKFLLDDIKIEFFLTNDI